VKLTARVLLLCLAASPVIAQEPTPLTEDAAAAIAAFYNAPATTRLGGPTRIAPGTTLEGDAASIGGPLVVAGTVRGDVVVINGDLRVAPGGAIEGAATIVGGRLLGDSAAVAGPVTVYETALRFRREGERIVALGPSRPPGLSAGRPTRFGRTEVTLRVDGSYNRVEGLPIAFGPRFELGHSNPTVLEGRLIYRTRSGLRIHPEEFGHDLRLEQYLGGHRGILLGLGLQRVIDPIEMRGVSNTENSLSTFVLHRDYRDHYERDGWRAYLRFVGRTRPYDAGVEYRDEDHASVTPGTPWSLLKNDEEWRPQPAVAEGSLRTLRGWFHWDSRNDRVDPAVGWLVAVEVEQGLEGELRARVLGVDPGTGEPPPVLSARVGAEFTAVQVDARRYLRLGPRTRVALRLLAAGSPDDGALPAQRQHVLGGEGSLPGFERFRFDCGARQEPLVDGFVPYYGCDRVVLLQAEYRFAFMGTHSLGSRLGLDFDLVTTPELILFADAGRAWIEAESRGYRAELGPGDLRYDIGAGLRLGRVGLYLAAPLSDGGDGFNFFIRLGPRI
jgi:hypothetical protein